MRATRYFLSIIVASIIACTMVAYRAAFVSNQPLVDARVDATAIRNVLNLTEAFNLDHVGEIAYVTFHEGKVVRKSFIEDPKSPYGWYHGMAERFLADVAASPHLMGFLGTAVIKTEDDATLPPRAVSMLASMGSPLLAHSIQKASRPGAILIPDWHFIEHHGFRDLIRTVRKLGKPLRSRERKVFWRGSTTGFPCATPFVSPHSKSALSVCQERSCDSLHRIGAARSAKNVPWLDIKVARTLMWCNDSDAQRLLSEGISVEENRNPGHQRHDEVNWIAHRGLFEIDGFVNAWGHLWRLASGSVVFKVDSDFTNAYLEQEVPGVHFIPLLSNLSDLADATKMIQEESSMPYLEKISRNANSLASAFTYEQEVDRVAKELRASWIAHKDGKRHAA